MSEDKKKDKKNLEELSRVSSEKVEKIKFEIRSAEVERLKEVHIRSKEIEKKAEKQMKSEEKEKVSD